MAASPSPDALPGLAVLEQTPIIIEKIVWAASDEQLHWKPAADRWSISEVLAHLADVEVVGFRERIQKMLEKKNPELDAYDQNAAYASGRYSSAKARENLKKFCHERDRSLSALRYVPISVLARTGQHTKIGPITDRPTNERVGVPRPRPHSSDRRTLSLARIFPIHRPVSAVLHDQAIGPMLSNV